MARQKLALFFKKIFNVLATIGGFAILPFERILLGKNAFAEIFRSVTDEIEKEKTYTKFEKEKNKQNEKTKSEEKIRPDEKTKDPETKEENEKETKKEEQTKKEKEPERSENETSKTDPKVKKFLKDLTALENDENYIIKEHTSKKNNKTYHAYYLKYSLHETVKEVVKQDPYALRYIKDSTNRRKFIDAAVETLKADPKMLSDEKFYDNGKMNWHIKDAFIEVIKNDVSALKYVKDTDPKAFESICKAAKEIDEKTVEEILKNKNEQKDIPEETVIPEEPIAPEEETIIPEEPVPEEPIILPDSVPFPEVVNEEPDNNDIPENDGIPFPEVVNNEPGNDPENDEVPFPEVGPFLRYHELSEEAKGQALRDRLELWIDTTVIDEISHDSNFYKAYEEAEKAGGTYHLSEYVYKYCKEEIEAELEDYEFSKNGTVVCKSKEIEKDHFGGAEKEGINVRPSNDEVPFPEVKINIPDQEKTAPDMEDDISSEIEDDMIFDETEDIDISYQEAMSLFENEEDASLEEDTFLDESEDELDDSILFPESTFPNVSIFDESDYENIDEVIAVASAYGIDSDTVSNDKYERDFDDFSL